MMSRLEKNKKIVKEIKKDKRIKISKKVFIILGIILFIILLIIMYGLYVEPKLLITNEYFINTDNPDLKGYKIIHFSDLYYDNKTDLNKIKEKINLSNPDLIFYTGDLINPEYVVNKDDIKDLELFFEGLKNNYGIYSVYGDNDNDTYKIIMDNSYVKLLDNEFIKLYLNPNYYINILGLNVNNIKNVDTDTNYTITLIHNYDLLNHLTNLNLAGDNLGGQVKLINYEMIKNNINMENYYNINNKLVYISNGISSKNNFRINNIPSINSYRLK